MSYYKLPELTADRDIAMNPRHNLFVIDKHSTSSSIGDQRLRQSVTALEMTTDFYVMNYLWFWMGDGKKAYGYGENVGVPQLLVDKVNNEFEKLVPSLGICIYDALERSIRGELAHAEFFPANKEDTCNSKAAIKVGQKESRNVDYALKNSYEGWVALMGGEEEATNFNHRICDMDLARKVFDQGEWWASYGGIPWREACDVYRELGETLTKPTKNIVGIIDKVLDMQHNTGMLLNHTEFNLVDSKYLDLRAGSRNILELASLASPRVQRLARACQHHLKLEPYTQKQHSNNYVEVTIEDIELIAGFKTEKINTVVITEETLMRLVDTQLDKQCIKQDKKGSKLATLLSQDFLKDNTGEVQETLETAKIFATRSYLETKSFLTDRKKNSVVRWVLKKNEEGLFVRDNNTPVFSFAVIKLLFENEEFCKKHNFKTFATIKEDLIKRDITTELEGDFATIQTLITTAKKERGVTAIQR